MENLFLVCLIPPAPIIEDIDEIRNNISDKYKVFESLKRPAHITLYNPVKISSQNQEEKFFKALDDAAYLNPFEQVLKNFNSFEPHTVYIDVVQNDDIMKLQAQIKAALKPLNIIPARDVMKFTPHLTIAFKDVKPVYQLIMEAYKDKNFKRTFTVNGFSVYKHLDKRWRPYKEFPFKNPGKQPGALSLFD